MAEHAKRRKVRPSDACPAMKKGYSAGAEPIAIVGIGCRFPGGANSPEVFWRLLCDGVDAITDIPADRPELRDLYDPTPGAPGKIVTREGGFLADLDRFDPYSFGISPREAACIDPQQRLLLEVAWEAFEDAGIVPAKAPGNAGVFIGMWNNDYEDRMRAATNDIDLYITTGGGRYSASGRLSFIFDLRGPSMTIDTACSSSLVAVHLACESLRKGETELALAGGVNLILQPYISIGYSKSKMLSPDARCKFGDAHANGYVRSEGAGIILLKPLRRALADCDPVYAVILGSAVNNDGQQGLFVAPSLQGQESVLRQAYRAAGIAPARVHYIEAHGTGTAVGDPVEIRALGTVLGEGRRKDRPFSVGSIKTNIGHTEAASGIAGLIKAALCVKHRIIPPSLHLHLPSPSIPWHELPLRIPQEMIAMQTESELALVGVNSFGVTGTNAHVVLRESPPRLERNHNKAEGAVHAPLLLPLSAPRPESLQANARTWGAFVAGGEESHQSLHDVCYTAAVRRAHHDHRLTVIGKSRDEIVERLAAAGRGEFLPGVAHGRRERDDKLVFVFSGQGPQWFAMGRELFDREPVYRRVIEECDRLLRTHAQWSLLEELTFSESRSRLQQTEIAQPAIFALQIGVAALWRSWGIVPDAVVGHSVGEVAAAQVAGVLDLEQAIRLIFHRGRLLQSATGGGKMAAAELVLEEAERLLAGYQNRLSIAAINSPSSVVISGASEALQEVFNGLEQRRIFCRFLPVNYAFHSSQVEPCRTELIRVLGGLKPACASIPIISTVTGRAAAGDDLDAEYWGQNVRRRVEFASAMDELIQAGHSVFVEIGPHPVLGVSIAECLRHRGADGKVLASLRRGSDERQTMLEALAALYTGGRSVDWAGLYPDGGRCVRLPSYAWQRERFWLDKSEPQSTPATGPDNCENGVQSFLGRRLSSSVHAGTHFWELTLQKNSKTLLDDHRIQNVVVLPGALTVTMFLATAVEAFGAGPHVVENVEFKQAMILRDDETSTAQLVLTATLPGSISCQLLSRGRDRVDPNSSWSFHAGGVVQLSAGETSPAPHDRPLNLQPDFAGAIDGAEFYRRLRRRGFQYGPRFQRVDTVYLRDDEVLGKLRPSTEAGSSALPADILDACFQLLVALASQKNGDSESASAFLPVGFERLQTYGPCGVDSALWAHGVYRADLLDGDFAGDVFLLGDDGRVIAEIRGLRLQRLQSALRQDISDCFYEIEWTPVRRAPATTSAEPKPPRREESWLIFADRAGVGEALSAALRARAARSILVHAGDQYEALPGGRFTIDSTRPEDFVRLWKEVLSAEAPPCRGIVHLWAIDAHFKDGANGAGLDDAQQRACGSALHIVQALARGEKSALPRFWLVTRGAQSAGIAMAPLAVLQAPLWGLGRVIALEHPHLRTSLIDLDPDDAAAAVTDLAGEIFADQEENQVAFRSGERYAARLVRSAPAPRAARPKLKRPEHGLFQLQISSRGRLDNLSLKSVARRRPQPGEVEIRVLATGLNFRDVLVALGMYPDDSTMLGLECAGTIVSVGAGVEEFHVGEEVIAYAQESFSSFSTVPADFVARKPERLSFEQSAGIPVVFLTAAYTLRRLAKIERGDRVLIHAAAGGVGLAAVQIAQHAGAEVYATAGSAAKRDLLKSLGVRGVMDSRSLRFADELLKQTAGRGVDVVLNSLNGEFIPKSLSVLTPVGKFLEIGKIGVWTEARVQEFKKDCAYFVFDLIEAAKNDPACIREMLRSLVREFDARILKPLPLRSFPIEDVIGAFRTMSEAKHVGKIVISNEAPAVRSERNESRFHADAAYLITGGFGALGLSVARWMVERGARCLALAGHHEPSKEARRAIAELERMGARVLARWGDVSSKSDVEKLLTEIQVAMPPLGGVMHCAGVLDDGVLIRQDWDRFARVMAPKVAGAWNLHALTRDLPLEFFVLFSSWASVLGSPGQGNYAAANAFMDALAQYRRAQGLPALSVNWGPWSEIGVAARGDGGRSLASRGVGSFTPTEGLQALQQLLAQESTQTAVMPFDLNLWRAAHSLNGRSALFERLRMDSDDEPQAPKVLGEDADLRGALQTAGSGRRRRALLESYIGEHVRQVLRLSTSHVDSHKPFKNLGLDSLTALELCNRLESGLKLTLSPTLIWNYPNIALLVVQVAEMMKISLSDALDLCAESEPGVEDSEELERILKDVEQLSDQDVLRLLDKGSS